MPQEIFPEAVLRSLQSALCVVSDGVNLAQVRDAAQLKNPEENPRFWQSFLSDNVGAPLVVDGIWGPRSRFAWQAMLSLLDVRIWGHVPAWVGGRASYYGGPDDPNDRYLGQAYLPDPREIEPETRGLPVSPAEYYRLVPAWVHEVLSPEMENAHIWPSTTDETGKKRLAGVSYFLRGLYCALRITSPLNRFARSGKLWVTVISAREPERSVSCRVIDYGPHPRVWASIDLSPALYRELNLDWGRDRVLWKIEIR